MDKIEKLYQQATEEINKEEKVKYEYNTRIVTPNVYEYKWGSLFRDANPFSSRKSQENFFGDADFYDLDSINERWLDLEEQVSDYYNLIATRDKEKNIYLFLYERKVMFTANEEYILPNALINDLEKREKNKKRY